MEKKNPQSIAENSLSLMCKQIGNSLARDESPDVFLIEMEE